METKPYDGRDRVNRLPTPLYYINPGGQVKSYTPRPGMLNRPVDFVRIATYDERIAAAGKAAPAPVIRTRAEDPEYTGKKVTTARVSLVDKFFDGINAFLAKRRTV